ncbi:hypothetical protein AB0C42_02090 [Micromonospora taraxaci]|uniref:hypothetical protein n=1 Tax=Micromonospora taraxaci TaxID=1316803 RepID=UPI0033E2966C
MDSQPVAGEPSAELLEAALRGLVKDSGPSVRKLVQNEGEGTRAIMAAASTPSTWSEEEKATAILATIAAAIEELRNPRWKRTTQAAFRIPAQRFRAAEFDSLTARWRDLAREDDEQEANEDAADRYRGYWRNSAAPNLARALAVRFAELNANNGEGWRTYRRDESSYAPTMLPLSFERSEMLYQFEGRRGVKSTNCRWLFAHGPVEYYEAVGWYYSDPDANVEIIPRANCELDGDYATLPQGGRTGRLRFSHKLKVGERYYFSYETHFNSEKECRPTILNEVRGLRTDVMIVRAQFDAQAVPQRCWYFDVSVQSQGWQVPPAGASEVLEVASNGYVDHEFRNCQHGRKYGLRWTW